MKRTLLIAAAALMLSLYATAQENGDARKQRGERPDRATMVKEQTDRMVKEYGLDEAQAAKLLELNQEYAGKMRPAMQRPSRDGGKDGVKPGDKGQQGDRRPPRMTEEQMKKMQAAREAYEAGLKDIMTEQQFKAYQDNVKKGPRGPRARRPEPSTGD